MMKNTMLALAALLSAGALSGCAAADTNGEATGENTYRLTEIRTGAFRLKGVVLDC